MSDLSKWARRQLQRLSEEKREALRRREFVVLETPDGDGEWLLCLGPILGGGDDGLGVYGRALLVEMDGHVCRECQNSGGVLRGDRIVPCECGAPMVRPAEVAG